MFITEDGVSVFYMWALQMITGGQAVIYIKIQFQLQTNL